VPARVRLALLLAASLAVAGVFFVTIVGGSSGDDTPAPAPGVLSASTPFAGSVRPPDVPPVQLRLTDQDGETVTAQALRGKVWVATFAYTTCEDTCPLTVQTIRAALDDLGHDVPSYAIAVDPPRDTPSRAKTFLAEQRITGRMDFLLGPVSGLERQWKAFGINRQTEDLEHAAYTIVVDRRGRQRVSFPSDRLTPEGLAHDIALLERES
jgi:protein SCO1/2